MLWQRPLLRHVRLFVAATKKATELAEKATNTARQHQATLIEQARNVTSQLGNANTSGSPSVSNNIAGNNASTVKAMPKWAMWTLCGCCLTVLSTCLICGIAGAILDQFGFSGGYAKNGYVAKDGAGGFSGSYAKNGYVEKNGTGGFMMTSTDLPMPISRAIDDGKEVWQLVGFQNNDSSGKRLYIILNDGMLENLVPVSAMSRGSAAMMFGKANAPDQDVFSWFLYLPKMSGTAGSNKSIRYSYEWTLHQNPSKWILTQTKKHEDNAQRITTNTMIDIVIDEEVGEGYWSMTRTEHTSYRGIMARFPDKVETTRAEDAFLPVLRK